MLFPSIPLILNTFLTRLSACLHALLMGPCPWTCIHPFDQTLYTDPLHSQIPNSCPSQSLVPLDIMPKLNPTLLKAAVPFWITGHKNISSTLKLGNLFSMLPVLWVRGHWGAQKKTPPPKTVVPDVDLTQSLGQSVCSAGGIFEDYRCQKSNSNEYTQILFPRYITQANGEWH